RREEESRGSAQRRVPWRDRDSNDVFESGLEVELVAFLAAQEVEARAATADGVTDDVREQDEPGRQRGALGRESGAVESDAVVPLQAHERRDRRPAGLEKPERDRV